MKGLDKQVYIYSLGTECFYTDEEYKIHLKLMRCYLIRNKIKTKIEKLLKDNSKLKTSLEKENSDLETIHNKIKQNDMRLKDLKARNKVVNEYIKEHKNDLQNEFSLFKGVRNLREDTLINNKIIGIFDSTLTRTIEMKTDTVSHSLFVVRAFYFNILDDIIHNGFIYKGERYIYFSSSAGQIRTKKTVFIKESLWNNYEKTLMCGLTLEEINSKGGCNINKFLAYKALTSSASVEWKKFDIKRTIVVPDLESPLTSEFDFIDRDTYEITRKELTVNIEHTDGCGMILPTESKKSFMVRLPFVKGLLVPFDFRKFAIESGNTKIKDIYGKEWDIIEDNITTIFTKSQFKMSKYYDDWNDYQSKFIDYKCKANKLNEEDLGGDVTLNYQMIQTLTDISDAEIKELCKQTNEDIKKIHTDKDTILKILGATKGNKNKNHFQQGLLLYPELINDNHSKRVIKDKKNAMINDARAGKLKINGKYLYLVPDLYAFCEKLFKNEQNPKGLLKNNEVFTSVFEEGKVDILRSPHLYKEHAVRKIVKNEELEKWFITQGIYTSVHDPISRILQFDNDGDKALVVRDDLFVKVAERNMKGIVPLYYEMGVAEAQTITNNKIYESLIAAFKANIGEVSNNITKIFNSSNEIDLDVVKWLTAENNYIIDFAKTLYMPTRPPEVNEKISKAIKGKVPHFFIEAKKKERKNVAPINSSTMNKLRKYIPNANLKLEDIAGELDYKMLMGEDVDYINHTIVNKFKKLNMGKKWIIRKQNIKDRNEGLLFAYKYIRDEMKQLNISEDKIVNVLIKDMYEKRNSAHKETLWHCYGDIIISNLRENLKNTKQCECCGTRIKIEAKNNKYCEICSTQIAKNKTAERVRKFRNKCNGF